MRTINPGETRGFTLVEIMLVVVLIGVLAAVALPSYSKYRERVLSARAVTDITSISAKIEAYSRDARSYPADLSAAGIGTQLDPWGNAYIFYNVELNGRDQARKDHALNPINSDFDLYSLGPDGQTKPQITQKDSVDDIIRASDGKFVGVAADF